MVLEKLELQKMKLDLCLPPYVTINSNWLRTLKLLKGNTTGNSLVEWPTPDISEQNPTAQELAAGTDK